MNKKASLSAAVFLDRDGTVSYEKGYITNPDDLELIPGSAVAIKKLKKSGFKVIVVTNQSAVARGLLSIEQLEAINRRFASLLKEQGAIFDGIYYCPHHPTEGSGEFTRICDCRKPAPGLFLKAAEEHCIDLSSSYIIGDKLSDISMAPALKAKGILVKTGYGLEESKNILSAGSSQRRRRVQVSDLNPPATRDESPEIFDGAGQRPATAVPSPPIYQNFIADDLASAVDWILKNERGLR